MQIKIILACRQASKYCPIMPNSSVSPLTSIEALTPEWLTTQLRNGGTIGADTRVTAVRSERIAEGVGFTSYLFRLHLELDGAGPATLVAKLPTDGASAAPARMARAYAREIAFYSAVVPASPLRAPHAHVVQISDDGDDFVLVMDDLKELEGADHLAGLSIERARRVIDELARFHAWGWGLRHPSTHHPAFVTVDGPISLGLYTMGIAAGWQLYRRHGRVQPPAGLAEVIDGFSEHAPALLARVASPATLLNGDLRADNLFFDADQMPTTVDFQFVMQGAGAWDVAYLVGQGLSPEVRGDHTAELIERYVAGLRAEGVDYQIEQAWTQFRSAAIAQVTYPLTAMAGWDGLSDRAKELLLALTERAFSIIADTDALSVLQT